MTKSSVLWNFYSKKMNVSQCFMPKEYPELPAGATAKLHEVRNASIFFPLSNVCKNVPDGGQIMVQYLVTVVHVCFRHKLDKSLL